ncbi:MAG: hypothetical protein ACXWI1_00485 [Croceibacterium sp.]
MSDLVETADRLSRRRARMMIPVALMFLLQQAAFFSNPPDHRTVSLVRLSGWTLLALVILAGLATGGFWFRPKAVRELMEDEVTRAHRAEALSLAFVLTMLTGVALFVVQVFVPVETPVAIHLVLSVGFGTALLRFSVLERRAHKVG